MAWFLGALLLFTGVALFVLGHAVVDDKIQPNWWAGIRIPSTRRSDEAWYAGHRAAALFLQAGGAILILGGVALLAWHPKEAAASAALAGLFTAMMSVLVVIGAIKADRAARQVG